VRWVYNETMRKLLLTLIIAFGASTPCFAESELTGDDVTISPGQQKKSAEHTIIEEFEAGGVRYIKVTPKKGPSYYLIDSDGDGDMDTRRNELAPNLMIPSWTIFSW